MAQLMWLDDSLYFPPVETALQDPDGLLAAGGDLSVERLRLAYKEGIFPWFSDGQPILWWSPNPRCVLFPDHLHTSKSLKKFLKKQPFQASFDTDFQGVIEACAFAERKDDGTWITEEMIEAYIDLHNAGVAHSVEIWQHNQLVGGLYGVAMGRCFFGESMFSHTTNASKAAFTYLSWQLKSWGYDIIDCQVENPHLLTLGAETIPRDKFLSILRKSAQLPAPNASWQFDLEAIPRCKL